VAAGLTVFSLQGLCAACGESLFFPVNYYGREAL
jgi:hypothetical protein